MPSRPLGRSFTTSFSMNLRYLWSGKQLLMGGGLIPLLFSAAVSAQSPGALAQSRFDPNATIITPPVQLAQRSATEDRRQFNELLRQGKAYVDNGNFPQAIAIYQQAASLDGENAELFGSMGYLYARQGQFAEATQSFQQALRVNPNNPEYYDGLGFSYARQGRLSEAASAYATAISLGPNAPASVKYRLALGVIMLQQGDYGRVRQIYNEIHRLQSDNEEAAVMMGAALLQSNEYEQLITFNSQALKLFPNRPELNLQLGKAYLAQGNLVAARRILEPRLNPDWRSFSLYLTWAELLEREGNFAGALDAYKQALRNEPTAIAAKIGTGRMYLELDNPAEAIWVFRDLTRLQPSNADFYYLLGEAYAVDEKIDLAKKSFGEAQKLYQAQGNTAGSDRTQEKLDNL
ncbi:MULTISPECIES: tetratricopeptide repeat protein [Synechocystis]|uniref:Tetratricopeptide repeat protein n=1 Tax=Synechocystis salina LEGE 00031 TaxID=1828736 RepID=A0ABR9VWZ5_9SYNC|nr:MULTISPECIES: tetratricopeptide repeat protein [Synechocystis]MBE9194933.1 tetratricopeptide repeat protein [Synechocystis sp. LEGE 06083]MBE9241644.1 tetratricopeptide repeat protein [Synechocystis salina LEGE 00041]MBE9255536.1 tetratricopeptide repeat protein [Synechocystis salina LEGE 00031]